MLLIKFLVRLGRKGGKKLCSQVAKENRPIFARVMAAPSSVTEPLS